MILLTIVIIILDFVSKKIISNSFILGKEYPVIRKFFYINYVKNTGVAWSLLDNKMWLIITISSAIIIGVIVYLFKHKPKNKLEKVAYSFVLGGAIGNLISRIVYGYVTDFIALKIFGYDYPVFNLADTFIVIGVILLIIDTWRCGNGNKSSSK